MQQPTTPRQTLEIIRNQHKELLSRADTRGEIDTGQVLKFLNTLAQAGAVLDSAEDRILLQDLISYWSRVIKDKTGTSHVVQLQHFNKNQKRTRWFKRNALIASVILVLVISSIAIMGVTNRNYLVVNPSPTSISFPTPISTGTVPKNTLFPTTDTTWTIIRGDVSYFDKFSGKMIFVKSINNFKSDAKDVGSLLAVQGSLTIIGEFGGSYDTFPLNTTVAQIRQILQIDANQKGCGGRCTNTSVAIVINGVLSEKYGL